MALKEMWGSWGGLAAWGSLVCGVGVAPQLVRCLKSTDPPPDQTLEIFRGHGDPLPSPLLDVRNHDCDM